jgi:hypothetical protein
MSKKASISEKESQVIIECVNIWISCISFDNKLINELYKEQVGGGNNSFINILVD